jgi:thioredoxin 2
MAVAHPAFDRHVLKNDIPVVIDFWAAWCGPCKIVEPTFKELCQELEPDWRFLRVDTEAEQRLAERFQIRSIPAFLVFRKGKLVAQRVGAIDRKTMKNWLLAL